MKIAKVFCVFWLCAVNMLCAVSTRSHDLLQPQDVHFEHLTESYALFHEDLVVFANMINHSERFKQKDLQEIFDFCDQENIDKEQLGYVLKAFVNDVFVACAVENKQTNAYKMYTKLKQMADCLLARADDNDRALDNPDVPDLPEAWQNEHRVESDRTLRDSILSFITLQEAIYGSAGVCLCSALIYLLVSRY